MTLDPKTRELTDDELNAVTGGSIWGTVREAIHNTFRKVPAGTGDCGANHNGVRY